MEASVTNLLRLLQDKSAIAPVASDAGAWLSFFSTLIWQLLIVYVLLSYGGVLRELLSRLSKLKVAGVEGEFQTQSAHPEVLPANTAVEIKNIGEDGFLTPEGVRNLISSSGLLQSDEHVRKALLLFRTGRQRTWLVSTNRSLFCVLDDPRTRKHGTLIQWRQPIATIQDVSADREDGSPVVNVGGREGWLYSKSIHPDPKALVEEIKELIDV